MSYTKEERARIAAQILDYMNADSVEYFTACTVAANGKRNQLQAWPASRRMTTHDLQRLELVARDVLGLVNHDELPSSIKQGGTTPPTT